MKGQMNFKKAQTNYEFILGPVKIKDGLFMGDQLAAKDIEFIISNKVTHVINTVVKVIPNLWERFGIQYLSVNWTEKEQNIFDKKNQAVNAIYTFIEEAMDQGESCLVHSMHGKTRCCSVLVAYLMKKYSWSLDKCLEFVSCKKENLEIRNNFLVQLQELEKRMSEVILLSSGWANCKNQEDLILRNTFHNAKAIKCSEKPKAPTQDRRISWGEKSVMGLGSSGAKVVSTGVSQTMTRFKDKKQTKKLKSILKGDPNNDYQEEKEDKMEQLNKNKQQNNFINSINGNVVHVTVNNFITTDKEKLTSDKKMDNKTMYNNRPYSSDNKQRDKRPIEAKSKLFPYDNIMNSFKSPYDSKLINKNNSSNNRLGKRKEDLKGLAMMEDRPITPNNTVDRRKPKLGTTGTALIRKEELMVAGKRRYPSTNPRDDAYKWK